MKWEDKRHIKGNEGRNVSCKSKHVDWTSEREFWVPKIDVWDTIELVSFHHYSLGAISIWATLDRIFGGTD